jgi:hypothetical protein
VSFLGGRQKKSRKGAKAPRQRVQLRESVLGLEDRNQIELSNPPLHNHVSRRRQPRAASALAA